MKTILSIITIVILNLSIHATEIPAPKQWLTENQKSDVLMVIDNICGDTWCEGDFNFSFNEVNCWLPSGECSVELELIWYLFDNEYNEIGEKRYPVTCELSGLTKISQMVEMQRITNYNDNTTYLYPSIADPLYDKMTDCITEKEDETYEQLSLENL